MAIDADLNAGLIGEEEARKRRAVIAQEADFFGSMDGASKFVRGDAVAGIIILFINIFGGLIVGVVMLILARSGALEWIARTVPKPVVRGIQVGLGLQLAMLALTRFMPADGARGWLLAAVALVIILALRTSHRVPAALVVLALGLVAAALTWPAGAPLPLGVRLPTLPARWPTPNEFAHAALLLAFGIDVLGGEVGDALREPVTPVVRQRGAHEVLPVCKASIEGSQRASSIVEIGRGL